MPLPWAKSPALIADVQLRCISVRQLRELRTFLQRLCKVGLVRTEEGETIHWFDLNFYHIVDFVVKPLISHLEDDVRGTGHRCSWAEFAGSTGEQALFHFIHAATGSFRDLMASVDVLVADQGLPLSTPVWLSAFASNPWGDAVVTRLEQGPCLRSIAKCPYGSVFFVDREGWCLVRIWCALELNHTRQNRKQLRIYTSSGMVGKVVNPTSLTEVLQYFDVTLGEVSQEAERRQILNYLGAGPSRQMDGLTVSRNGRLALAGTNARADQPGAGGVRYVRSGSFNGAQSAQAALRKHRHSESSNSRTSKGSGGTLTRNMSTISGFSAFSASSRSSRQVRRRLSGNQENEHETQLLNKHRDTYSQLSMEITDFLQGTFKKKTSIIECARRLDLPQDRGIRLGDWRTFTKRVRHWADLEGFVWEDLTVDDIAQRYVKEVCGKSQAFCEQFGGEVTRRAQYMIEEPKQGSFGDYVSSVEWFAEAMHLKDEDIIWCQLLCIRQHEIATEFEDWLDGTLPALIKNCDGLCSFLPKERSLVVRCNRMLAWQLCFENARSLYLACATGVLSCAGRFAEGGWTFGLFDASIARIIVESDWQKASSADPRLGNMVCERISNSRGGFDGYTARLYRVAAGPVLREIAGKPRAGSSDMQLIRRLCRHEAVMLTSPAMAGCLRETAVHVAAGSGNMEVLEALLDLKADPNAEDHIRETPLHWAALTGHASCAKALLRYGARVGVESAFAETPRIVAGDNLSAFLGHDASLLGQLLTAWENVDEEPPTLKGQDKDKILPVDVEQVAFPSRNSSTATSPGRQADQAKSSGSSSTNSVSSTPSTSSKSWESLDWNHVYSVHGTSSVSSGSSWPSANGYNVKVVRSSVQGAPVEVETLMGDGRRFRTVEPPEMEARDEAFWAPPWANCVNPQDGS